MTIYELWKMADCPVYIMYTDMDGDEICEIYNGKDIRHKKIAGITAKNKKHIGVFIAVTLED